MIKFIKIKKELKEVMLIRVERHIIKRTDKNYSNIKDICHKCKNLYNYTNYILRQRFFKQEGLYNEFELSSILTKENQDDYRALPAQTSQQVIKLVYKNWKSYFQAIKSYKKDKSRFLGCPKPPKYKPRGENGYSIALFTNQQAILKNGLIKFPKQTKLLPIRTKASSIKQVRLIPNSACFIVEVVYEKEVVQIETTRGAIASIDLGINNFVTFLDNQGYQPFIINGKGAKSFNQYYHKTKAKMQSKLKDGRYSSNNIQLLGLKRSMFMQNFLHQSSSLIIKALKERKISTLVIGLNEDWKQECNMGKRNNQNFISIPHKQFIDQLVYKCEEIGVEVILTEEAYTSKIDHFIGEEMKYHSTYAGRRIHRGLFKSSTGVIVNADINGALGIMRKVFPEEALALAGLIMNSGVAFTPVIVNSISCHAANIKASNNCISLYTTKKVG
jgi:transposase, IS605 orfB family